MLPSSAVLPLPRVSNRLGMRKTKNDLLSNSKNIYPVPLLSSHRRLAVVSSAVSIAVGNDADADLIPPASLIMRIVSAAIVVLMCILHIFRIL